MAKVQFSRVLLKLSGESLKGSRRHGIDPEALDYMAGEIKSVTKMGVELGIVVGGGNIWRGSEAETEGMDRATADYAGMLATVISALALQESMERKHSLIFWKQIFRTIRHSFVLYWRYFKTCQSN